MTYGGYFGLGEGGSVSGVPTSKAWVGYERETTTTLVATPANNYTLTTVAIPYDVATALYWKIRDAGTVDPIIWVATGEEVIVKSYTVGTKNLVFGTETLATVTLSAEVDIVFPLDTTIGAVTQTEVLEGYSEAVVADPFWEPIGDAITLRNQLKAVQITQMTTIERLALTPINGMVAYDTDINRLFQYEDGAWRLSGRSPEKTFTVSPSGGDYTTIQAALTANAAGGELFIVYPGTYTDTINFTANDQCVIGHGNAPQQIVQQADATVADFGAFTGCYIERINMKLTAPTVVRDMITGSGDLLLQLCRLETSQSAAITGAQSTIINTSGTVRMYLSTCIYNNTSVAAGGDRKEMFNLTGTGSLIATSVEFEFTNTGTSFVSTVSVLDVTTTTLDITGSKITGSANAGIAAGIVDVTVAGSHGSHDNIYIISSAANDAHGIYASGTGTYESSQNHFHITSTSGNAYGFLVGASMTLKSAGDDIIAADENSIAGILEGTYSLNHVNFSVTGTLTVDTAFAGNAFLDEDDMVSDSATGAASQQSIKAFAVAQSDWLQNGFDDASAVTLAWTDAAPDRTLTISPTAVSYDYFIQGKKYNETGNLTAQITDTEGLWAIYFDSEGVLATALNPSHAQIDNVIMTKAIVAYVYWDATNNDGRLMTEKHGSNMSPSTHHWLHDNMGAVYREGMALANFDINQDGNTTTDAQFSIASGEFYDEDIEHDLSAVLSTAGVEIWYLDGTAWRWITRAGYSFQMSAGDVYYNNAGAQTAVGNNDFCLGHIFATNITDDAGANPKYIAIQGQYEYANRGAARAGAEIEINQLAYGTLPLQEIVPVATFIIQNRGTYGALRTTESGDNFVDWRTSNLKGAGGTVAEHGALAGLSDDDHAQYALLAGRATVQTFADSLNIRTPITEENAVNVTGAAFDESSIGITRQLDSAIGAPALTFKRIRATGSTVQNGDWLGMLNYDGYYDATNKSNQSSQILGVATENFTAAAHGSELIFKTTPNGTTTPIDRMSISNDGAVDIGARVAGGFNTSFNVTGDSYDSSSVNLTRNVESNLGPIVYFNKKRETTHAVDNGDTLGGIVFQGYWGSTGINDSAVIRALANENFSSVAAGSRIEMLTTPAGTTTPTIRLVIETDGDIKAPGVYSQTTGSSTNVNVDSNGYIRRSTSALKYKDVQGDLSLEDAYNIVNNSNAIVYKSKCPKDDKTIEHLGFIADDAPDDRLVFYNDKKEVEGYQYERHIVAQNKIIQDLIARVATLEDK